MISLRTSLTHVTLPKLITYKTEDMLLNVLNPLKGVDICEIKAGYRQLLARSSNGELYCWGSDKHVGITRVWLFWQNWHANVSTLLFDLSVFGCEKSIYANQPLLIPSQQDINFTTMSCGTDYNMAAYTVKMAFFFVANWIISFILRWQPITKELEWPWISSTQLSEEQGKFKHFQFCQMMLELDILDWKVIGSGRNPPRQISLEPWQFVKTVKGAEFEKAYRIFRDNLGGSEWKVSRIFAIDNATLQSSFESEIQKLGLKFKESPHLFKKQDWKQMSQSNSEQDIQKRMWTSDFFEKYCGKFAWNRKDVINVIPMIHGASEESVWSICASGFSALATLNDGFYGRGM